MHTAVHHGVEIDLKQLQIRSFFHGIVFRDCFYKRRMGKVLKRQYASSRRSSEKVAWITLYSATLPQLNTILKMQKGT